MTRPRPGAFSSIRTEGGLLSPEMLARVVDPASGLDGTAPADYHLLAAERLGDVVTKSWNRLVDAWRSFADALAALPESDATATSPTRERWLLVLFEELGYGRLQPTRPLEVDGTQFPVSHRWADVPVHLVGAKVPLDRRTPGVRGAAGASPHSLVQDLLNRSDHHLWGFVSNGLRLRILRDNRSLTRQAFVDFDLETMMADEVFDDFVVLWLTCHQSRVEGEPAACWLERWHQQSAALGTRALDALRGGVERAIAVLGQGFLASRENTDLRAALRNGALANDDYYRQLLRLVYRLIFLLVAEDRGVLVAPATPDEVAARYRRYYAVGRLRPLAGRPRSSAHGDLWQGLAVVFRSLGMPDGEPLLGLPGLGGFLWSEHATPDLDRCTLANAALLGAVGALAFVADGAVRRPVDFSNLGSEELGSVYESLLELHPEVDADAAAFVLTTAPGHERKTTGSYYTPAGLISTLLDSALDPVLDVAARAPDPEAAVLRLRVFDPACGSGHFLVAAAHRMARRLAAVRTGEEQPAPDEVRHALRDVVARCLFGVDLNPMAVELCKVSLWLEAVEPERPLPFLDHHVVCGNSLLGATAPLVAAGIPDDAYKPLTGDDKTVVSSLRKRNKAERAGVRELPLWSTPSSDAALATRMLELDALPDADSAGVAAKEARWRDLVGSDAMARAKLAADAWCAAFVVPKVPGAPAVTTAVVRLAEEVGPAAIDPAVVAAADRLAAEYGFLHLHLAFPQVFAGGSAGDAGSTSTAGPGGFDVVLGNPPWEKVKLSEREFFARSAPDIAAASGAARKKRVAALPEDDPVLYAAYQAALHHADGESALLRTSGRYPLCGRGDVNTYAVFAELMRSALSPEGRCGVIVPSGVATDDTTKHFFGDLVETQVLVSLYDFENREGVFPAVDSRIKFCLLTLAGSERPTRDGADFAFFCHRVEDLRDEGRRFTLTADELALVNPNTRTCPVFRTRRDAELTLGIYRRVPVLLRKGPPEENPWDIHLTTMFHMTNDSGLFRTAAHCEADGAALDGNVFRHPDGRTWLPLYEGKMVGAFDHRAADVVISGTALVRQGQPSYLGNGEHSDSGRLPVPRSWVSSTEVDDRLPGDRSWLIGFCDITSATNERTMIAGVIPRAAVGNNLPLLLSDAPPIRRSLLAAVLSSFAFDSVARHKVGGTHLNFFIVEQLPVLAPDTFAAAAPWDPDLALGAWLIPRILELTYTARDLDGFAADLGYDGPPFRWDDGRRALLRAELDGCFFHLYGIERDDVEYILSTFPIVRRRDEAAWGEYRTARLILEAYDAMAKAADSGDPYQTTLTPPPAAPSLAHHPRER